MASSCRSARGPPGVDWTHDQTIEAAGPARAGDRHELDLARLPGLEAHRRAGRDVEATAARSLALELERGVGLEEMVVRADLNRAVAGIRHLQGDRGAVGIESDLAVADQIFAGNHQALRARIGSWT